MASSSVIEDDWGPALPSGPRTGAAPATPQAAGSLNSSVATASGAQSGSKGNKGTPPPAIPTPLSVYNRPLSEDPIYQAALQQARESAGIATAALPTTQLQGLSLGAGAPVAAASPAPAAVPGARQAAAAAGAAATPPPPPQPRQLQESKPERHASAKAPMQPATVPPADRGRATLTSNGSSGSAQTEGRSAKGNTESGTAKGNTGSAPNGGQPGAKGRNNNIGNGNSGGNYAARAGSGGVAMPGSTGGARNARYEEYLPQEELQKLVKKGAAYRGKFRVNVGDRREGYVTIPGFPHDLLIRGERQQNRAVEGDEVVVSLQPVSQWFKVMRLMPEGLPDRISMVAVNGSDKELGLASDKPWSSASSPAEAQAIVIKTLQIAPAGALRVTGKVVAITAESPRRQQLVGVLQADPSAPSVGGEPLHWFLPLDPAMPRGVVAPTSIKGLPEEIRAEALQPEESLGTRTLMSARLLEWGLSNDSPLVELRKSLGQAGEIEAETAAILEMEGVRSEDFAPEVLACLPPTPWTMSEEDIQGRRDFRSHRVFSIDPPTAKDLDDALHIEPIEGKPGRWRVGVHIADVSHFIPPFSALDYEAGKRSTSVYLVQRVIPMLPRLLCEELCSLNPGVDRFAFSVEWELDEQGLIHETWFGKSVIRSCAKLAYPMVQAMIDDRFVPAECPAALHDGHTWDQVIGDCMSLHRIARNLRATRFNELGALRLDNMRLFFKLDKDGNPSSCGQYVQAEANQLVEEFMLLANMSVARFISSMLPDRALLRRHPPPNERKMTELQALAQQQGLELDCSGAAQLQASLQRLRETCEDRALVEVITLLATKPQNLAQYFCTGESPDMEFWRHYALAVNEYTHFTSPIRRYPDVVVHRLLSAALKLQSNPGLSLTQVATEFKLFSPDLTGKVAEHCNEKRLSARNAQDASLQLYLCVLLRRSPMVTQAVVTGVGGNLYFSVYVPELGVEARLYLEDTGIPLSANFDQAAKTLIIKAADPSDPSSATSGGGQQQQRGYGQGATGERGQQRQGGRGGQQGNGMDRPPAEHYAKWLASLPPVTNLSNLQATMLPLQVRLFDRVPVIAHSPLRPGKISDVQLKLWLDPALLPPPPDVPQPPSGPALAPPSQALTVGTAVGATPNSFSIPYESMLND